MKYEKTIIRDNNKKIKIQVKILSNGNELKMVHDVFLKENSKWISSTQKNDSSLPYRAFDKKIKQIECKKHASQSEINEAYIEALEYKSKRELVEA